ncbi:hypothetical protein [Owenweeksia hongkongensis]|uniref:hypothetical protein n=1 Tax=Owenweeksia hongkongensis TaxID=253245 RepID=UPI003A8FAE78
MKNWLYVLLVSVFGFLNSNTAWCQNAVELGDLYEQLSGESEEGLALLLEKIGEPDNNRERASKGVLLMKFAAFQSGPGDKLSTFKEGHTLLENAISKEPENSEYLFFRLLIQENAPRILGYSDNIEADASKIRESYNGLSQELKNAILAYSKTSKALNSEDLD